MQAMKATALLGTCFIVTTDSRNARAVEDPIDVDVKVLEAPPVNGTEKKPGKDQEVQTPRLLKEALAFLEQSSVVEKED